MKKSEIKLIQLELKNKGKNVGKIDGIRGKKTNAAIQSYLLEISNRIDNEDWQNWSEKRKAVASLQLMCLENEFEAGKVDGLYGPQTEAASELFSMLRSNREIERSFGDIVTVKENPHSFPYENVRDLTGYYGVPCEIQLVKVKCPWTLKLDWELSETTQSISIHNKLSDSLSRVLEKVYTHYGETGINKHGLNRYGGSYNCRKKRGSTSSWSTHAWGISIDWYPSKNKLKWRSDRASLAHPELDFWWEAWEKEGWMSLGRSEDRDWMHVQAAKR